LIPMAYKILSWPVLLLLAAQAARGASPALAPAAAAAVPQRAPQHLLSSQVDIVELLAPPPAADSPAQQADLQAVLQAQRRAHADGTLAHAVADVELSCGRFSDALGEDLSSNRDAKLLVFLNESAIKAAAISGPAKRYWKRTRPYAYSSEVEPLADMSSQWKITPPMDIGGKVSPEQQQAADALAHSSYPSGHATFGTVCAILLADMVPEKRQALFARNLDYEHSRMVVGAHFPTDLEAGRIAGTLAAQLLLQNAKFRNELAAARVNLRATLALPPLLAK
jgi:acid phosphatase (class A)